MNPLKIVGLTSENVKNIKLVHIEPKENVIVVSGPNAAGKSALLDSFWMALAGKDALKHYPDPIRHGEENAKVELDLGDIIVTRTWTKNKTYLKIENKEGAVFKSPQSMLDKLNGQLTFDPNEFALSSEKEQVETLMNLLGLSDILTGLDTKKKLVYNERTLINRQIKDIQAVINSKDIPDNIPDEEISTVAIMENYQAAINTISENKKIESQLEDMIKWVERTEEEVFDYTDKLKEAEKDLEHFRSEQAKLEKIVANLVYPDTERFKCNIDDADRINALVRKKAAMASDTEALSRLKLSAADMTSEIEEIEIEKTMSINSTKLPIRGLSFDNDGVTYNNIPLKQCSSGEQLQVSVAVAMALNPTLKIIRVADGSLLDSKHMKIIEDMAREHDYQVWIEVVDETGKIGVYIEEGEVVTDNYNKVPKIQTYHKQPTNPDCCACSNQGQYESCLLHKEIIDGKCDGYT